jgi:hypothetical protein
MVETTSRYPHWPGRGKAGLENIQCWPEISAQSASEQNKTDREDENE